MINRREFVGGLAAVVVGSQISACTKHKRNFPAKTVDVYFHGLWVFIDDGKSVSAYAPCSRMHCYMVGRDNASLADLPAGAFQFSAAPKAGSAHFSPLHNRIDKRPSDLSGLDSIDRTVKFPVLPRVIESFRFGTATYDDNSTSPVSMVQKLTFDFESPTLTFGSNWSSAQDQKNDVLHLFAETTMTETRNHARGMMNAVSSLLKLPWSLAGTTYPEPTTDPNLKSLFELNLHCHSEGNCKNPLDPAITVRSSSVGNCIPVIIGG